MNKNTEMLHQIMEQHHLNCIQVAELINRKPVTVRVWRTKSSGSVIPDAMLELLKLKLAAKAGGSCA